MSEEIGSVEAARLLGVHPQTVLRWADAGALPFLRAKTGSGRARGYRFDRSVIERRAAARREYLGLDPIADLEERAAS